jgi:hypothetical protein
MIGNAAPSFGGESIDIAESQRRDLREYRRERSMGS